MTSGGFTLDNREEIVRFEHLLQKCTARLCQVPINLPSLIVGFDAIQSHPKKNCVFYALLDIRLHFICLQVEIQRAAGTWNECFSKGKLEGGSVLDSEQKLFGKMSMYGDLTSFTLRCRALWDKVMGFLVLLVTPNQYDEFIRSKSRRRKFLQLARKTSENFGKFGESLAAHVKEFDEKFRTAEAHGAGRLRKWVFLMESLHENPQIELLGFSSVMAQQMELLERILKRWSRHLEV